MRRRAFALFFVFLTLFACLMPQASAAPSDWDENNPGALLPTHLYAQTAVLIDADARSMAYLSIDESDEQADHVWHVRQVFSDPAGDHDFAIAADVDLDASQEEGEAVFKNYRVGFFEEL